MPLAQSGGGGIKFSETNVFGVVVILISSECPLWTAQKKCEQVVTTEY